MPAAVQDAAPSINQIYAAFDDDCYHAFRRAMARSRGGVVRVEDLLAALAETLPERTAAVLGLDAAAVARLARPRNTGHTSVYRLLKAHHQSGTKGTVT